MKERRDKREKRMSLSKFTKIYQKNNYYMVSDIMVPNPLRGEICPNFSLSNFAKF